jgi:hypothetical protein
VTAELALESQGTTHKTVISASAIFFLKIVIRSYCRIGAVLLSSGIAKID